MYELTSSAFLHKLKSLAFLAAHLPLALGVLWTIVLAFCQPLCAVAFIPFIAVVIWRLKQATRFRLRTWTAFFCLCEALIFFSLPGPQPDKWQTSTSRATSITKLGDGQLRIAPIRDFIYRTETDFDVRYLDEEFNPKDIVSVCLAECFRGQSTSDCELMLSFAFNDGRHLVISPEIRIPAGETENAVRAYYKNYGLIYVFGTEEDLFALRTDVQHRYLSLYPLKADAEQAQQMFADCLDLARETQAESRAYHPLQQTYRHDLLAVLRTICPALPETAPIANANVAKRLYRNGATLIEEKGEWDTVRRRYAVGFNIKPEVRETYSDAIRARIGLPVRSDLPERHAEVTLKDRLPSAATLHQSTAATRTTVADIPEPGDRLANDKRRTEAAQTALTQESDKETDDTPAVDPDAVLRQEDTESVAAATRELDKNEQLLDTPRKPSLADSIPEPGARLRADMLKEEEEEEAADRQNNEIGSLIRSDKGGDRVNNAIFGGNASGVRTTERSKGQQEAHPLDPVRKNKRKNPFNDEPEAPQDKEVDPFAPKEPIRI